MVVCLLNFFFFSQTSIHFINLFEVGFIPFWVSVYLIFGHRLTAFFFCLFILSGTVVEKGFFWKTFLIWYHITEQVGSLPVLYSDLRLRNVYNERNICEWDLIAKCYYSYFGELDSFFGLFLDFFKRTCSEKWNVYGRRLY